MCATVVFIMFEFKLGVGVYFSDDWIINLAQR
jgi:hypothetical protein